MIKKLNFLNLIIGIILILEAITIVIHPFHLFLAILLGIVNIMYGLSWHTHIINYLKRNKDIG